MKKLIIQLKYKLLLLFCCSFFIASAQTLPNISRLEYFIDTDPGFGKGTAVSITPATDLNNLSFTVNISSLTPGFHNLHVRAQDANGKWSIVNTKTFYKDFIPVNLPNIVKAEYFVDNDPGFGKGVNIALTPATDITKLDFTADISSYSAGKHRLFVRAMDANGKWSITNNRSFVICSNQLAIPTVSGKTTYCPGETIQLNGSTVTGATSYLWKGPNNFTSTQQNISITNITAANAGKYTLVAIRAGGTACDTSNPAIVDIILNAPGIPQSLGVKGKSGLCPGDSVILSTNQVSGFRYRWLLNGNNTANAGDTTNSLVVKTSGTYNVRVTNTSGCSYLMHDTLITVFAKPATSNISGNSNVLLGSTENYSVNNNSGSTYAWFVNNGTLSSGNGTNTISVNWPNQAGTGSIKVVETNANGCSGDTQVLLITISRHILNVNPKNLDYIAAGESKSVTVSCDTSWSASTDQPSWVSINPANGSGNGNVDIKLSANTSSSTRNATVTFTAGALTQVVNIIQDFTTGIGETSEISGINIFPNPSVGIFTVENKLKKRADVRVYDATGRIVDNFIMQADTKFSKDYSHLPAGIYLMSIVYGERLFYQRIVIAK